MGAFQHILEDAEASTIATYSSKGIMPQFGLLDDLSTTGGVAEATTGLMTACPPTR